ncbi:MAG: NosD domain-containing protein [Chloroflexota bacterium]
MRARPAALALILGALALGSVAAPATAAGGSIRWVDDDGRAGPTDCHSGDAAATTIQKGVDAADPGDTVLVCPGDYTGRVVVGPGKDGVAIVSVRPWLAKLHAPDGLVGTGSSLLTIARGADDVTVRWLTLLKAVPAATPPAANPTCGLDNGIHVLGRRAQIQSVRVRATGSTYSPCGLRTAILVGAYDPQAPGAAAASPASATVSHSALRDFYGQGILARGAGVRADILRNSVRYWHLSATRVPCALACLRPGGRVAKPGLQRPAGTVVFGVGIAIGTGAAGLVYGNEVAAGPDAQIFGVGGQQQGVTPPLIYGIGAEGSAGTDFRLNNVHRAVYGVWVSLETGDIVKGNVVTDHLQGITIADSSRVTVNNNQSGPGQFGIFVSAYQVSQGQMSGQDNVIRANTALGNSLDCVDITVGSGTGTLGTVNTWKQNTGFSSNPIGLCGSLN